MPRFAGEWIFLGMAILFALMLLSLATGVLTLKEHRCDKYGYLKQADVPADCIYHFNNVYFK